MVLGCRIEVARRHAVVVTNGFDFVVQQVFAYWGCVFGHGIPIL
jgi:hypothetical protein